MQPAHDVAVRSGGPRRSSFARPDHHRSSNFARPRPEPSLGSIRGNSTPSAALPFCPSKPGQTVRSHAGYDVPADCGRVTCPVCIFPITRRSSRALAMAQPSQFLTITGLARSRDEALGAMQRVREWFRRRQVRGAWAYHLEVNHQHDDAHAHVWWRGDNVSKALLAEVAKGSGAGYDADVRRAYAREGSVKPELAYGFKAILRTRPARPTVLSPAASEYLALNGGQLVNASHGFWTDWNGEPVPGGAVRARAVANGWTKPFPRSDFLRKWHRAPITSRSD